MSVIALFFPAVLSLGLYEFMNQKKETGFVTKLVIYAAFLLLVNVSSMLFVAIVLGQGGVLEEAFKSFLFFAKYCLISSIFAIVYPAIISGIKRCIKVTVKVEDI